LRKSLLTPQEEYEEGLENINRLLRANAIDLETFGRAEQKLRETLERDTETTAEPLRYVNRIAHHENRAIEANSADAFSFLDKIVAGYSAPVVRQGEPAEPEFRGRFVRPMLAHENPFNRPNQEDNRKTHALLEQILFAMKENTSELANFDPIVLEPLNLGPL
jgi:hypothetical protein